MAMNSVAGRSVCPLLCVMACTFLVMLTLLAPFTGSRVQAAASVTVDPTVQYQTLEGWGTSLAWFAHVMGGAPDETRSTLADLLFDPNTGLGLNIVRYNIGGGENPKYLPPNPTFLEYRARVPGYKSSSSAGYDWTADPEQRWFLQAAIARGATHIEMNSNSAPYWMTNSGSVTGSTDGTSDNLNPAYYDAFADYLATVAQHFQDDLDIQIRTVDPLNEPSAVFWKFGNRQEGCHFDRGTQNTVVKKLGAALATKGVKARVSASDESDIDDAYLSTFAYDSTALSYMSQINTHTYSGSNRTGVMVKADDLGKTLWMSETGDGDATGLTMSQGIIKDMKEMQPTGWVYWQAIDDVSGPGWGMIRTDLNNPTDYSYAINQKYYVMMNYSKFIRPGYTFIHNDNVNTLSAYYKRTNTLVIVTTNATTADETRTYDLTRFGSVGGSATPYRTSSTEDLAQLAAIGISNKSFSAVARAKSVTTYVISGANYSPTVSATINDNTTGTGVNQFNYTGTWGYYNAQGGAYLNDNHWSGTAGDTYTVAFSGTRALIYAARAPNQGIAAMSVDGGGETEVDLYAVSRSDNQFIYGTPTLPSGAHTLKVRVTGRKNPAATNAIVPADRVDIASGSNTFDPNARYRIVNRKSGQVANVNGASTIPGEKVIQWYDTGGNNTLWRFSPVSGGFYKLINYQSGLLADVNGASPLNGAGVIQWNDNGGANQHWSLQYATRNYYRIVNRNSGLLMEVTGASTSAGADVIQWANNGGTHQRWYIMRVQQ